MVIKKTKENLNSAGFLLDLNHLREEPRVKKLFLRLHKKWNANPQK